MFDFLKNTFLNRGRYKTASDAVIISCFFNPQNNPYRLLAFQKWYQSIKHLNHRIIECLIGPDAKPQLPDSPYITRIQTDALLWHKESLLNKIVAELPPEFQYVFWVDADVLFTNDNWLVDGVKALQTASIIQPFEYCIHLERNQLKPSYDVDEARATAMMNNRELDGKKRLWRSFAANYVTTNLSGTNDYDKHGHVGFAWGARREVLDKCPLYDRALIGGADHIIAHAAAGQIPHPCIENGFADNIEEVLEWSRRFFHVVRGRIGFVQGDLYHIWHGDIKDRQYLKRIKDFMSEVRNIKERDKNGLHTTKRDRYVRQYFANREVHEVYEEDFDYFYDEMGFYDVMGYMLFDYLHSVADQRFYDSGIESDPNAGVSDPWADIGAGTPIPVPVLIPVEMGGGGVPDPIPNEQVPFEQGGAGIPDDGRHVITDEMLQGATIHSNEELETAIHHAAQPEPEFVPGVDPDSPDNGNFS